MKFNAADLEYDFFMSRARKEATEIYTNEDTRKGRNFVQILQTTLYGHAPEVYLIQEKGFIDNLTKYKDVLDSNGNEVEVKTTEGDYFVPYVLKRANEAHAESWRKYPDHLYVFIGDKITGDYELYGTYKWNGKEFSLQSKKLEV